MIQQVNLYQDALKQQLPPRSAINTFIVGLVALALLLIGFSLYIALDLNETENDLLAVKQQLNEAEMRVQLAQIQYPKQQINTLLKQQVSRSQITFNSLSQVISLLANTKSDQTQGFSRYFSALARQSNPEVWLSNINIDRQQQSLELQGSSYYAEKIPLLLQKLQYEPIFQGKKFVKLSISQAEESGKQIDFMVSTVTELEKDKHD